MDNNYSVLMTVYSGETAPNLDEALGSMFEQSIPTDDFVLVCDGQLTPELDDVVARYQRAYPSILKVLRLPKHEQWAALLNEGLDACKNRWVARMDSDDISVANRCEKQLEILNADPDLCAISTALGEFFESPDDILSTRQLPRTHEDIVRFSKFRCPLNHATVLYDKEAVQGVGGYEHYPACEDYQLWVKLIKGGYKLANTDQVLYLMRAGKNLYKRRGGRAYLKNILLFKKWMYHEHMVNVFEYCFSVFSSAMVILMPSAVRGWVYRTFLRKQE